MEEKLEKCFDAVACVLTVVCVACLIAGAILFPFNSAIGDTVLTAAACFGLGAFLTDLFHMFLYKVSLQKKERRNEGGETDGP